MIKIRKGELLDGPVLSDLAMIVVHQMDLPLVKKIGSKKMRAMMEECLTNPKYRYSYMQAIVAEIDGEIVGAAFGYPNEQEDQVDEVFDEVLAKHLSINCGFTDTEAMGEEWYLDTIAVFGWARHHGVCTKLIKALPQVARSYKKDCIGLNVDFKNPKAEQLYYNLGFRKTGTVELEGHKYTHMRWHFDEGTNAAGLYCAKAE